MSLRLAVDNTRPRGPGWVSGLTPVVQKKLDAAARAIKRAIAAVEAARQAAEQGTDADLRCEEALHGLEQAREDIEWTPDMLGD